jgi:hypothetical protein
MAILSYWQDTIKKFKYVALVGGGISLWMINGQGVSNWVNSVTALNPVSVVQGALVVAGGTAALDMISAN